MTPLEQAKQAATDALMEEAGRFSSPVRLYVYGEAESRARRSYSEAGQELPYEEFEQLLETGERKSFEFLSEATITAFLSKLNDLGMMLVPREANDVISRSILNAIVELTGNGDSVSYDATSAIYAAMIAATEQSP